MSKYINAESLVRKIEGFRDSIVTSNEIVTSVHRSSMDFVIEVIENMPCLYADDAIQEAMKAVREKALNDFAEVICEKAHDNNIQILIKNLLAEIITLDFVSEMSVDIAERLKGGDAE